jgi:hypothetical protein
MTPKEKAIELFDKFELSFAGVISAEEDWEALGKECALIAVDMVIKCCKDYDEVHENYTTQVNHWQEVKQEIEKL